MRNISLTLNIRHTINAEQFRNGDDRGDSKSKSTKLNNVIRSKKLFAESDEKIKRAFFATHLNASAGGAYWQPKNRTGVMNIDRRPNRA